MKPTITQPTNAHQPSHPKPLLLLSALLLSSLLISCDSYYKVSKGPLSRYHDRATPRTIYVGQEKQTAWIMNVEDHHLVTDYLYGSMASTILVFEPPPWPTKWATQQMETAPPWHFLRSESGARMDNLREMASLAFPPKRDPDAFRIQRNSDDSGWELFEDHAKLLALHNESEFPIWVISIEPLVFAIGENQSDCVFGFSERPLQSFIFAPRAEDFDCNIIAIAAFTGIYPPLRDSKARIAAKDEFHHLTFDSPLSLGELLNQSQRWSNFAK